MSVLWCDCVLLDEVAFLYDRIGKLKAVNQSKHDHERYGVVSHLEKLGGVAMKMIPVLQSHNTLIQLPNLIVLALLAFMRPVALARDDIVRGLVWSLGVLFPSEAWSAGTRVLGVVAVRELYEGQVGSIS